MKPNLGLILWALLLFAITLQAEDWTTTDGKVYPNVTVIKQDPDAITILYRDGGALIPLTKLPPDLQKRFNYNPIRAKAAAETRAQADAKSAQTLQAEIEEAKKLKSIALAAQIAKTAKATPAKDTQADPLHTDQFDLNSGPNSGDDPNHHRRLTDPLQSDPH
jgi:hypothetical protein